MGSAARLRPCAVGAAEDQVAGSLVWRQVLRQDASRDMVVCCICARGGGVPEHVHTAFILGRSAAGGPLTCKSEMDENACGK